MSIIEHIEPGRRSVLAGLFAKHKAQRMLIDSVIEGDIGTALADSENEPQVAQLTLGAFTMFGGDTKHPVARELVQKMPRTWVVPVSEAWCDLMLQVHGECLEKRQQIEFSSEELNIHHLRTLMKVVPEGFQIKRIGIDLARRCLNDGYSKFVGFSSLKDFVERGIGFCVTIGGRIVSFVASYTECDASIEIQIETDSDFRRKELATAVSATLIVHCLEHGIDPRWTALNSISAKLAEKLGYIQDEVYEALKPSE